MDRTGNTTVLMLGVAGMGLSIAMFLDALKMKKPEPSITPIDHVLPMEATPVHHIEPATVQEEPEEPVTVPEEEYTEPFEEPGVIDEGAVMVESPKPKEGVLSVIEEASNESETVKDNMSHSSGPDNKSHHSSSSEPTSCIIYTASDLEIPTPPNSPVSDQSSNRVKKHRHRNRNPDLKTNGQDMTAEERVSYRQFYQNKRNKIIEEYNEKQPDNSYYGDGTPWSKRMYFIKEAYRRSREQTPVKIPYK